MIETIIGIVLALIISITLLGLYCCVQVSGEITKKEDDKDERTH